MSSQTRVQNTLIRFHFLTTNDNPDRAGGGRGVQNSEHFREEHNCF